MRNLRLFVVGAVLGLVFSCSARGQNRVREVDLCELAAHPMDFKTLNDQWKANAAAGVNTGLAMAAKSSSCHVANFGPNESQIRMQMALKLDCANTRMTRPVLSISRTNDDLEVRSFQAALWQQDQFPRTRPGTGYIA
jgi:hypothetical protein